MNPQSRTPRASLRLSSGVFLAVVGIDQFSKTWVLRNIDLTERIEVVGPLSLVRRYNTGVAFSLGQGSRVTAWLVTGVVIVLVGWVVRTIIRGAGLVFAGLLATIAGGGVGNQLDRIFRGGGWNNGAVVDFLDVGFWPVFNVADAALSVGCTILAIWILFGGGPKDALVAVDVVSESVEEGVASPASLQNKPVKRNSTDTEGS